MTLHKIQYAARPIRSISSLAKTLDISEGRLIDMANRSADFYSEFTKPVKGKQRHLADPVPELKVAQKKIITRVFCHLQFPHYLHGGIKSTPPKDFVTNASAHKNAQSAVALDIKKFFPSITIAQVKHCYQRLFNFSDEVSDILAKLTTLHSRLPQGAPTSSYIANIVMFEKEYSLAAKFESQGFIYTRLIDDMTISSEKLLSVEAQGRITSEVINMLKSYNFKIHPGKKQYYSRSNPKLLMQITGLWLNRGSPRLHREKRMQISHQVAELYIEGSSLEARSQKLYHDKHSSISGNVSLLQRLRHSEADRLRSRLIEKNPIFNQVGVAKIKKIVNQFCNKTQDLSKAGYIRKFYVLQHAVSIVKRTQPGIAKNLQKCLNLKRPTKTTREINE